MGIRRQLYTRMETNVSEQVKHTPGRWLIQYAETSVRWPVIVVKDDTYEGGEHEIAEVCDHVATNHGTSIKPRWVGHPDREEGEANARLIAAAPDLLAACRAVDKLVGELMAGSAKTNHGAARNATALMFRELVAAAIAKAEQPPVLV